MGEAKTSYRIIGHCGLRMWGQALAARTAKQFNRAGIPEAGGTRVILVRADAVIDAPLIAHLAATADLVLLSSREKPGDVLAANVNVQCADEVADALLKNKPPSGTFACAAPEDLKAGFWKALRKKETPYALAVTPENEPLVAWRMFMGTYKGATDLVTKHVWPVPAFYATRWLAALGVTPNMVTTVAAVATALAFGLFLYGHYWSGLIAAWLMTFLDTVDGKLARTTLTSSKFGDIFDHGIDLVHPPFWYLAWIAGLGTWGIVWEAQVQWWVGGIILGSYVLQRVMEGVSIWALGLEIHIWRPVDTLFRKITARRNPNLLLLSLFMLVMRPDIGIIAVAIWSGLCLVLHGLQLLHALWAKAKRGPLTSWMSR